MAKKTDKGALRTVEEFERTQRTDAGTPLSCSTTDYGGFGKCLIYPPSTISLVDGHELNTLRSSSGDFLLFVLRIGLE